MAVVLTAGPDAAASHRSAAALLGIPGFGRAGRPEVTTPRARRHRGSDAIIHRWRPFPSHHLTIVDEIPTTRVARTLVDLAGVVHPARSDGYVAPESALEARFLDAVRDGGLPEPVRQVDVGDRSGWVGRIDFAWSRQKLLVELDGPRHHSAELDRESDRERDNRLVADGWRVVRVRWHDLDEADQVVTMLRRLLTPAVA